MKTLLRSLLLLLVLFLTSGIPALAQGAFFQPSAATTTAGNQVITLPAAQITVCGFPAVAATGTTPCTNKASLFTSQTLGVSSGNPFNADQQGNFSWWAAPAGYTYSICTTASVVQCVNYNAPVTMGQDASGNAIFPAIVAPSGTFSGPVTAQSFPTCVPTDATGATNMSAQIQTCINAAITNKASKIVLPCGTYLISTPIDMTNKPGLIPEGCAAQFQEATQGSVASVGQTTFLCNTGGVGWDFTGSGDGGMRNFRMLMAGTGITTPCTVGILRGRDNGGAGGGGGNPFCFAERQKFENFAIIDFTIGGFNTTANGGRGYIGIYNDGAESGKLENFAIATATPLVYTNSNVASVTSPYQTLGTGCNVTMTGELLDTGAVASNSAITQPNIEADGTANMEVNNVTFIGGSCSITFEGANVFKWHVVANAESENATNSFLCSSFNIDDSYFHVTTGTITAFLNPTANNLTWTNNQFLFQTPAAKSAPLITNTATGTRLVGGMASFNADTTASNTTVLGTILIAPTRTTATLQTSFNAASGFLAVTTGGLVHIGAFPMDIIREITDTTALEIQDFNGIDHIFVSGTAPHTNTFIRGNGSGAAIFGVANTMNVADTTGRINNYGGIVAPDWGVLPVQGSPQHLSAQNAALAATNLFAAPAAGVYRVCFQAITTTSGTGTTATVSINWTDAGGAKTFTSATWALNSVTSTGQVDGCKVIRVASGAIQVSTAGTFGTSVYALDAWVEREN